MRTSRNLYRVLENNTIKSDIKQKPVFIGNSYVVARMQDLKQCNYL
jgi:hypothetical protein